VIRSDHTEESA